VTGTHWGRSGRGRSLAVLFLAVGTDAIFQVFYEITKLIRKDSSKEPLPVTVFSGVVAGMLLL